MMVRVKGLEPPRLAAPEPKSGASTVSPHPHRPPLPSRPQPSTKPPRPRRVAIDRCTLAHRIGPAPFTTHVALHAGQTEAARLYVGVPMAATTLERRKTTGTDTIRADPSGDIYQATVAIRAGWSVRPGDPEPPPNDAAPGKRREVAPADLRRSGPAQKRAPPRHAARPPSRPPRRATTLAPATRR